MPFTRSEVLYSEALASEVPASLARSVVVEVWEEVCRFIGAKGQRELRVIRNASRLLGVRLAIHAITSI